MKIHHVGYLVKNINQSIEVFSDLGYVIKQETVYDVDRDIDICFMENDGVVVELVAPRKSASSFKALRKRVGNSPYHICYIADNFLSDINDLEEMQKNELLLKLGHIIKYARSKKEWSQEDLAEAIDSRKVVFLYHPEIGLIEIVER